MPLRIAVPFSGGWHMSNHESDWVVRILDLAAQEQIADALSMLQETEENQTGDEAAELESCRRMLQGVIAIRDGRFEAGLREALPALAYLEQRFRQMEHQYRNRLAAVARNTEILMELEQPQLPESETPQRQAERVAINRTPRQPLSQLDEKAVRDALTGSLNRRGLTQASESFFVPGKRMALAKADIDHFKSINDHYGPHAGDKILRSVAQILVKSLRDSDRVARLDGDEFALFIDGVGVDAAWGTCERLRLAVERYGWGTIAPGLRVTLSFGLAIRTVDDDMDALTSTAENALSQAKAAGRNQVVAGG